MKCILPLGMALAVCAPAAAQTTGPSAATQPIAYGPMQVIFAGDSSAVIAEKAAKVLPRPIQSDWMRMERTFFIHFGHNTFRHVEWGNGREEPSQFAPSSLDAHQWMNAVKEGGGKMVIPVAKHHDGFCLWPSRYTSHSVAASPWLDGKGDVIRAVSDAARARGIKLGIYLSPADLYQLRTNPRNPNGYYGNRSPKVRSVIPTDPASFKTDPTKGRTPPPGFTSFTYEVDDYNRYYLNQIYELFTEYGPIHEINLDGANPDRSVPETYDYAAWYDLIRRLQPEAIISVKGPDSRWVGNESGVARTTEWSVIPLSRPPESFTWPDMTARDLGSRARLTAGSTLWWYPAETNVPILHGWFWAPRKPCRTASELIDIYYQSVGRNSNWLLNLSPDSRGLIPDDQMAHLRLMAQVVDETFVRNLAAGGTLSADNTNPAHGVPQALDGTLDTWWEAAPGQTAATLTLKLPAPATFDVISLQEAVDHRSQRIESFAVETWSDSQWMPCVWNRADEQTTTVGRKRLLRLRSPVTTDQVRIRIADSRIEPTLAEMGLFKQAQTVQPPVLAERDVNGSVKISDTRGLTVVYTTDGSMPTPRSAVYGSSIDLPRGGVIHAACVAADGRVGMMATRWYSGYAPAGWKVVSVDDKEPGQSEYPAANSIDGKGGTFWQIGGAPLPHSLTVDMGRELPVAGFSYLPRQDRNASGVVDSYRFETSADGQNWTAAVDQGRFGNMRNNPVLQEVAFKEVAARYFRFTALREVNGNSAVSAAEITVLPPAVEAKQK